MVDTTPKLVETDLSSAQPLPVASPDLAASAADELLERKAAEAERLLENAGKQADTMIAEAISLIDASHADALADAERVRTEARSRLHHWTPRR